MPWLRTCAYSTALMLLATTAWRATAQEQPTGELAITSPSDYQVFQRQSPSTGVVHVRGRVNQDCDTIEARLQGDLKTNWQTIAENPKQGAFQAEMPVLAGGWYRLEVRSLTNGKPSSQKIVEHVGMGEVFVIAGQSNSTNWGSEKQKPGSGMVASFDGIAWRIADDPQAGVQDGSNGGSFAPAFGDAMYAKYKVPIGVASVGCGGTSVRQWLPKGEKIEVLPTTTAFVNTIGPKQWECDGTLFAGLMTRIGQLGRGGFRAVLWHQGESDANQIRYGKDRQISPESYQRLVEKVIRTSQEQAGWKFPWFVAQATYHLPDDPSSPEFRQAQKALWETGAALEGPDTDTLMADYRDGVHFNGKGLQAHGKMWAEKVGKVLGQ
jgi:hypothetical protein